MKTMYIDFHSALKMGSHVKSDCRRKLTQHSSLSPLQGTCAWCLVVGTINSLCRLHHKMAPHPRSLGNKSPKNGRAVPNVKRHRDRQTGKTHSLYCEL